MDIKIQYNGRFPNLCSGNLTVIVDGVSWEFPKYCLVSGGGVSFNENWDENVWHGNWGVYNLIAKKTHGFSRGMNLQFVE